MRRRFAVTYACGNRLSAGAPIRDLSFMPEDLSLGARNGCLLAKLHRAGPDDHDPDDLAWLFTSIGKSMEGGTALDMLDDVCFLFFVVCLYWRGGGGVIDW